ncbi:MAG: formylglycine-generating enzyme family protein, partial [Odoribacter sp.]|nr:formylglycine-generating enzyme family protein [Odoribacter sp.]
MNIKWFAFVLMALFVYSCSPFNGGGELTGTRKTKKWFEPQPYGMVLIPTGSLNIGNNDEDITWAMSSSARTISVPAFWMDETEITNDEYRQFVAWVVESIQRQRVADEGYEEFL